MKTFAPKPQADTHEARHHRLPRPGLSASVSIDTRPAAIAQRKLQRTMNQSARVQTLAQLQDTIQKSPRQAAQRQHAAQMQARANRGAGAAAAVRLPQSVNGDMDAREAAPRVAAPSRPVVQRFQLRKWQVKEQAKLAEFLPGEGPWETDKLSLDTRRKLYALLSQDHTFSQRTAELARLKQSIESTEPSTQVKEEMRQVAPEVSKTRTGVSTPPVQDPEKAPIPPRVTKPSPLLPPRTSLTPVTPQEDVPRVVPREEPRKETSPTLTTPLPSPEQTGVRGGVPDRVESIEPVKTETRTTDPHDVRVKRAMATIPPGTETSEEAVMKALVAEYGSPSAVVEPSKTPEFASALLESIRSRQSKGWVEATKMVKPSSQKVLPGKTDLWTIRHYTNKATVTLGEVGSNGLRKVLSVDTPPFNELLSMVTLTAMRMHGMSHYPLNLGPNQKLHTNSSSKTSGHTSALDWKNIGNIGDTFYALFYNGKSATGVVPAFITDALYYAEWKISEFGEAWASSDWLSTAAGSKSDRAKRPSGQSVEGPIQQVIAHQLDISKPQANALTDDETVKTTTASKLTSGFENFEIKKHGSVKLQTGAWQPANPGKINEIKSGYYDAKDTWTKG